MENVEHEPEKLRKKRKVLKIIAIAIASVAFAILMIYLSEQVFIPQFHYSRAESLLAKGDIDGAIKEFEAARWYKDAADRNVDLCIQKGREMFEAGDYEGVLGIFNGFISRLHNSPQKGILLAKTHIAIAQECCDAGDIDGAIGAVDKASGVLGSVMTAGANYSGDTGKQYQNEYRDFFESPDGDLFFSVIKFISDEGRTQDAINTLEKMDAVKRIKIEDFLALSSQKAKYALGELYLAENRKAAAARAFQAVGDFEDAQAQMVEILGFDSDGLFGGLEWYIIPSNIGADSKLHLISKTPVASMALHDGDPLPDSYDDFSLANYLMSDDFYSMFNDAERERIMSAELPDEKNILDLMQWSPEEDILSGAEFWVVPNILQITTTSDSVINGNREQSTSIERCWNPRYVSGGKVLDSIFNAQNATASVAAANIVRDVRPIITIDVE